MRQSLGLRSFELGDHLSGALLGRLFSKLSDDMEFRRQVFVR